MNFVLISLHSQCDDDHRLDFFFCQNNSHDRLGSPPPHFYRDKKGYDPGHFKHAFETAKHYASTCGNELENRTISILFAGQHTFRTAKPTWSSWSAD